MRTIILALVLNILAVPAALAVSAADCRQVPASLKQLAGAKDPELRSRVGTCLVRFQLDHSDVARQVLKILRDPSEDILLREDLIVAFSETPLRRKNRIEARPAPKLGRQDQEAVDRTVAGASDILAVTSAMRTMEDTSATTPLETEFFRVLSDIALDDNSHVLLRACAVSALEKISSNVFESGLYDEKSLRMVRDALRSVSARDDEASYSTEAYVAYGKLVNAGLPGFTREAPMNNGRMISSVKAEK